MRMAVKGSTEGPLIWRQKPEQQQWLVKRERGAYLLRTNLTVNGVQTLEEVHAADGM